MRSDEVTHGPNCTGLLAPAIQRLETCTKNGRRLCRWHPWTGSARHPVSSSYESQQVGVNRFSLRGRHAVREAFVSLQRPVLQQLCRQWCGVGIRNDLIVVAVHHQDRHGDLLEVISKIGLGESNDAI